MSRLSAIAGYRLRSYIMTVKHEILPSSLLLHEQQQPAAVSNMSQTHWITAFSTRPSRLGLQHSVLYMTFSARPTGLGVLDTAFNMAFWTWRSGHCRQVMTFWMRHGFLNMSFKNGLQDVACRNDLPYMTFWTRSYGHTLQE